MFFVLLSLAGGLVFLTLGAEGLVRGGVTLAHRLGYSPLFIGLTVVSLGTVTPELMVSLQAAVSGQHGMALGTALGSNLFNLGAILALCALVTPIAINPVIWGREGFLLLAATIAAVGALHTQPVLPRGLGLAALVALLGYLVYLYRQERNSQLTLPELTENRTTPPLLAGLMVAAGAAGLALGANLVVAGASTLAQLWQVPPELLGLTLLAIGTSLPEVAVAVAAAWRGQTNLLVGNLLGSSIYNILGIIGLTTLIQPLTVPAAFKQIDVWVALAAVLAFLVLSRRAWRLGRPAALLLLAGYGTYLYSLLLR